MNEKLLLTLQANASPYLAGLKLAAEGTRSFGNRVVAESQRVAAQTRGLGMRTASDVNAGFKASEQGMQTLARSSLVAGGLIAAGLGFAIKQTIEFDHEMSVLKGVTNASAGEFRDLQKAVLAAGASTVFTATESAQAATELAKAGVSTRDIINGGLVGALNLAAAGSLSLSEAASIAASTMNVFGLRGTDVTHVADVLANAANKAQGGVHDMSLALQQSSLVAHQLGLSLEDTVGTLTLFAKQGFIGSDAGTSFKQMLLRLSPQSAQSAQAMKELGISMFDAKGQFIGIQGAAQQLHDHIGSLTPEMRALATNTIFGSDAVRAANILIDQGAQGLETYRKAVDETGTGARLAGTNLDNLSGDIEKLHGALQTGLITTGHQGNGVLRELVQSATSAVNVYNQLPPAVQGGAAAIAGISATTLLAVGAAGSLIPKYREVRTAIAALGTTATAMSTAMKVASLSMGALAVVAAAGTLIYAQYANQKQRVVETTKAFAEAIRDENSGLKGSIDQQIISEVQNRKLGDTLSRLRINQADFNLAVQGNAEAFDRVGVSLVGSYGSLRGHVELQQMFSKAVTGSNEDLANFNNQVIKAFGPERGADSTRVINLVGNMRELNSSFNHGASDAQQLSSAVDQVVAATGKQGVEADQLRDKLLGAAGATQGLTDEQKALQQAIQEFVAPVSVYKSALQDKQEAERQAFESSRANARSSVTEAKSSTSQQTAEARKALQSQQTVERESLSQRRLSLGQHAATQRAALAQEGLELQKKQRQEREAFDAEHTATTGGAQDYQAFSKSVTLSLNEYAAALEKHSRDMLNWRANLITVAARIGPDVALELAKLGSEAAPLVAQFANGTDRDTKRAAAAMRANMAAGTDQISSDIDLAFQVAGVKAAQGADATAESIAKALGKRVEDVRRVMSQYTDAVVGAVNPALQALGQPPVDFKKAGYGPGAAAAAQMLPGQKRSFAEGGVLPAAATIASPGTLVQWAEPETGGEAFIPLAESKRSQSTDVLRTVAHRFDLALIDPKNGGSSVAFASGGIYGATIPKPPKIGPGAMSAVAEAAMEYLYEGANAALAKQTAGGAGSANAANVQGGHWQDITSALAAAKIPFTITSTTGGVHAPNSYHYRGKAVDLTSGDMMQIFNSLRASADKLAELFYTPAGYSIKNSKEVRPPIAAAGHYNHVHAAVYDKGGYLQPGWNMAFNGTGKREAVVSHEALADAVGAAVKEAMGDRPVIGQVTFENTENPNAQVKALRRALG